MKHLIDWSRGDVGSFWGSIIIAALIGFCVFAGNRSTAEEPSPWTYLGGDTYIGSFKTEYGLGVYMTCIMVRNPHGMAAGAAAIACK